MSPIFIMMQGGVDVQHPFDVVGYGIGGRKSNKIHKKPIKVGILGFIPRVKDDELASFGLENASKKLKKAAKSTSP